jgi:hypothetical protein
MALGCRSVPPGERLAPNRLPMWPRPQCPIALKTFFYLSLSRVNDGEAVNIYQKKGQFICHSLFGKQFFVISIFGLKNREQDCYERFTYRLLPIHRL